MPPLTNRNKYELGPNADGYNNAILENYDRLINGIIYDTTSIRNKNNENESNLLNKFLTTSSSVINTASSVVNMVDDDDISTINNIIDNGTKLLTDINKINPKNLLTQTSTLTQDLQQKTSLELQRNYELVDILKSTGKTQKEGAEYKYKIFIKFDGNDGNYYDDTLVLSVFRMGFIKSGAFFILRINLPPVTAEQVKMAQNSNKPLTLRLYIYSLKTDAGEPQLHNCVLERPLIVRSIVTRTNAEIERGNSVMCDLLLTSVTLYNASITYSYNKIHNTKTPYEVLTDYESFMKSTYGDNFESVHILSDKNEHRYEQIVTKPTDQDVKLPNNVNFTYLTKTDVGIP